MSFPGCIQQGETLNNGQMKMQTGAVFYILLSLNKTQ